MSEELPDIFAWFMHGERMQDGFFGAEKVRYVPESRLAAARRAGAREVLDLVAVGASVISKFTPDEVNKIHALIEHLKARYAEPEEEKKG